MVRLKQPKELKPTAIQAAALRFPDLSGNLALKLAKAVDKGECHRLKRRSRAAIHWAQVHGILSGAEMVIVKKRHMRTAAYGQSRWLHLVALKDGVIPVPDADGWGQRLFLAPDEVFEGDPFSAPVATAKRKVRDGA